MNFAASLAITRPLESPLSWFVWQKGLEQASTRIIPVIQWPRNSLFRVEQCVYESLDIE